MANTTKLIMQFGTDAGETMSLSYNYIDPAVDAENVQALAETILTGGSIFEKNPIMIKAAKLVTTTETDVDLGE